LDVLHDDDIWISDTAASNHFAKSKVGAFNMRKTDTVSQGMTGNGIEASCMMDFNMTQSPKQGI